MSTTAKPKRTGSKSHQGAQPAAKTKVSPRRRLRQHYATDLLDASTLLAAPLRFLPGNDERLWASVLAIADELTESGPCWATSRAGRGRGRIVLAERLAEING